MKKAVSLVLIISMIMSLFTTVISAAELDLSAGAGAGWTWTESTKTLTLEKDAEIASVQLPAGAKVVVNGNNTIAGGDVSAITCEGALTVEGEGKLTLTGSNGIKATSVAISGIDVDFVATSCGIQVYNDADAAIVTLTDVNGKISGGYAGIYVNGECAETEAKVVIDGCKLDAISTATSYNNRARKSGITVYVSTAEKVNSSIIITDSKVNAIGSDAGLAINNYLGDADATNSACSRIEIKNSTVVAEGTNGTWSGIFASVLGQHPDSDTTIAITDSSVYAVSPNTGILTSSQKGESKIILDNSILGAEGKTALSMIEPGSQAQAAELKNGSTYVQMTPAAVMKGEIVNFDGKTIVATAGSGITYDANGNYFVIPKGSAVTESYTNGTSNDYTFNKNAGGVGGSSYEKEEVWGFDVPGKWETGDIIIYTPADLIEFATRTQPGGDLGDCAGRNVYLGADIDMESFDWYYRNAEGTIVTDHRIPAFSGIFDGQGYTIKNMKYRDEFAAATDVVPLAFIIECSNAPVVLKNLNLDTITVNTVAPARFAGLVDHFTAWQYKGDKGSISGVTVSNVTVNSEAALVFGGMMHKTFGLATKISDCHVKNFTVNAKGALSGDNSGRCGGFIATGGESTDFVDCSVENFVVNTESTGGYLGGFIGGASVSGDYTNCDVKGFELNAVAKFSAVGGFTAYTAGSAWGSNSTYENCDVSGLKITTTDKINVGAGGFIGNVYGQDNHRFINCTTEGTISGNAYAGGFAGWLYGRNRCSVEFTNCSAAVNILDNDYYGGGFVGNFTPYGSNVCNVTYTNCTASGDVFAEESIGSFLDADAENKDGIIGGTYSYDPENVDSETGETNNVAPGYRALDNGDGTWTVFPDNGKEVVKVAFFRFDENLKYENWRTVEVFKGVDFFEAAYNNALNYSHPTYRFANGIGELDEEADDKTPSHYVFDRWVNEPYSGTLALNNEIKVEADMNVYAQYEIVIAPTRRGFSGSVELDGKPANGFDFRLVENGKVIATATSQNGTFSFDSLSFDSEGKYVYEISQIVPSDTGIIDYDEKTVIVEIKVYLNDAKTAYLSTISVKGAEKSVSFQNTTIHVHTEETVAGFAPTCTESGLTDGVKCSECGETLEAQEEIAALGHTEEVVAGKAPTCTEAGLTDGVKCSECGEILVAQEEIAALGHTEEVVAGKAPTCTEAGLTDGVKCSVCGETLVAQEEIAALGHTPGEEVIENVVEATATSGGSYDIVVYCTVCGTEIHRETVITEAETPKDPAPETTEPEDTTEAPEVTTEPEDTTEVPEDTTKESEETTAEPEEEITDEPTPRDPAPETGDSTLIIAIIAIASIALAALYIKRRQVIED